MESVWPTTEEIAVKREVKSSFLADLGSDLKHWPTMEPHLHMAAEHRELRER